MRTPKPYTIKGLSCPELRRMPEGPDYCRWDDRVCLHDLAVICPEYEDLLEEWSKEEVQLRLL